MKNSNLKIYVLLLFAVAIVFSGCSKSDPLPEVNFEVKGGNRPAPVTAEFTNLTQHADSYKWDFKDGNTSEEVSPTHTFEEPGTYDVSLTATNNEGSEWTTKRVLVYGELLSWTPSRISLIEDKWETEVGSEVYVVLRHANGNIFHYNEDETYSVIQISFGYQSPQILTNFNENMELSLTDGSAKFEILRYMGGETVDPDNDPIVFEHTMRASDIVPDNDTDPYLSEVTLENKGAVIEVKYNEAE